MVDTGEPSYVALWRSGVLAERAASATARLSSCDLCARNCGVDRRRGIFGAACRTGLNARVASFGAHHGEETPISGRRGSGTIFFTWCNMRCLYCQNHNLSWTGDGCEVTSEDLAAMMLSLQKQGCHNINLVSPSHVLAQVLSALVVAAAAGLRLPIVYNTGGYDRPEALSLLDGVVDIYMPDMKYADSEIARRYSKIHNYVAVNKAAVAEMHRQVGDLVVDADGVAHRGLLVRHLILPNGQAGTEAVLRFIADEISPRTRINLMTQYRPCHRTVNDPELGRRPNAAEFRQARETAHRLGFKAPDGV